MPLRAEARDRRPGRFDAVMPGQTPEADQTMAASVWVESNVSGDFGRVATTTRRRSGDEWVEKTNYFTVEVYGAQARACAEYLAKGSRMMVDAELDWREWTDQHNNRREAVTLRARQVTFEGGRARTDTSQDSGEHDGLIASSQAGAPVDGVTAGDVSAGAEDLPF